MYEPWPPRATREEERDLPVSLPDVQLDTAPAPGEVDDPDGQVGYLSPLHELRFVRQTPGAVADHIDYAVHGAYSMPASRWRDAHVIYAYTVAGAGITLCRAVEWAFFHRLSRALLAVPVALALLWLLNHLPVVQWLVPDQWDASTWFAVDAPAVDPGVVEVPLEVPPGGGA